MKLFAESETADTKCDALAALVVELPTANRKVLQFFIAHLKK
jgi:hypothetical protein